MQGHKKKLGSMGNGRPTAEQPDEADRSGWADDSPGDPVCWLRRVCPQCGALSDTDPPTDCRRCHAPMPVD
jgi:hypothetical protein